MQPHARQRQSGGVESAQTDPVRFASKPVGSGRQLKRHKGQGCQVQVMETYCDDEAAKPGSLNPITHVQVEPARNSDAKAIVPAIESVEKRGLKPQEIFADSLYGSDENCKQAKQHDVELIAPSMGQSQGEDLNLEDFGFSEKGEICAGPQGNAPAKVRQKKRASIGFAMQQCENCPDRSKCPVKKGKKYYYLRYTDKEIRLAKRRIYERSDAFKDRYRWRAGVEATMSAYDRRTGGKRLRVRGLKAVRFCDTPKALGVNIFRAAAHRAVQWRRKKVSAWPKGPGEGAYSSFSKSISLPLDAILLVQAGHQGITGGMGICSK